MASSLQPAQDGDGEECGGAEGPRKCWGGKAVYQVWLFRPWTCLGTLENSPPLCASVSPSYVKWRGSSQISGSRPLHCSPAPAVGGAALAAMGGRASGRESPALCRAPPHLLQGPWGARALLGTPSLAAGSEPFSSSILSLDDLMAWRVPRDSS